MTWGTSLVVNEDGPFAEQRLSRTFSAKHEEGENLGISRQRSQVSYLSFLGAGWGI